MTMTVISHFPSLFLFLISTFVSELNKIELLYVRLIKTVINKIIKSKHSVQSMYYFNRDLTARNLKGGIHKKRNILRTLNSGELKDQLQIYSQDHYALNYLHKFDSTKIIDI